MGEHAESVSVASPFIGLSASKGRRGFHSLITELTGATKQLIDS